MEETLNCPQCGLPAVEIQGGVCKYCCTENQQALDQHNAEFKAWKLMTDAERRERINQRNYF